MAYSIVYLSSARKDLKSLSKDAISNVLDSIKAVIPNNLGKDKELSGSKYKGYFSFRVGEYRVIYTLDHNLKTINIIVIAHRKESYKILSRRI